MYTIKPKFQMMRHLLMALGIGMLLTGCGLAGGHGSLASGNKYQAEGEYRSAYIQAKKVLQKDKKNGDAWLLLGKASLMLGNPKDALHDLQQAKAYGVATERWVIPTGEALRVSGQFKKLLETLPADTSFAPDLQARVKVLRGDAYRGLSKPGKARLAYQAALQLDSDNVRALIGMARLAANARHTTAVGQYVQRALAAGPDNPEAWTGKADAAFANGNLKAAEKAYQKALQSTGHDWLPQDRFMARLKLARVQAQQGQFDKALTNIGTLEKMAPQQPQPHYLHAVVLYKQGHLDDAVSQLQLVLRASPDNVHAQLLMGAVNYAKGNYGQAQMYVSNVIGMAPKNRSARKLLALTFYRQGRSGQALKTLRSLVSGQPSDAELLALLQRAAAQTPGESTPATAASSASRRMQQMASLTPPQDPRFAEVNKAIASGNATKAIDLLKAMPADDDATGVQRTTLLVKAYVLDKHVDKAVETAADYAIAHPDDSAAHLLYGTALIAGGKHDKARSQYLKAHELDPDNVTALLNLGSLDVLEHHYKDATDRYKSVLKQSPQNAVAMVALGRLAELQHDRAHAIERFQQAIAVAPGFTGAYVRLIVLYSRMGQFDQAADTARNLVDAEPGNAAALNALGAAELNAGHHQKALKPLQQAVKLAPDASLYRINLARAQVLLKDTEAAQHNLERAIKADPGQVKAVAMLAFMKLHDHDLPGALALTHTLQRQAATKAAGYALEGDLYMSSKSYDKAATAYQRALSAKYSRPLVIRRFLALRAGAAKQPEAGLREWLTKHADDMAARMLLAQYYLAHAQQPLAADQYEKILDAYPSNVSALNNLAWIYTGQHNDKAVALAKRAHDLAPQSPGIADTYGWALIAAKQYKAALPILEKAAKAEPDAPTIQYHLAVAQARSGDRAGAHATLAALQHTDVQFPEQQAAKQLYQQLSNGAAHGTGKTVRLHDAVGQTGHAGRS
ncbi:MAG TPA: XrtA/PEP-CTERM system TPR-repeat protein PrsT [Oleiagrimonas sp.]|nr:XrtA/PEP-CTERM system TPR-repeat protein PrsT [Oleiagrimonas sp.]